MEYSLLNYLPTASERVQDSIQGFLMNFSLNWKVNRLTQYLNSGCHEATGIVVRESGVEKSNLNPMFFLCDTD